MLTPGLGHALHRFHLSPGSHQESLAHIFFLRVHNAFKELNEYHVFDPHTALKERVCVCACSLSTLYGAGVPHTSGTMLVSGQ